MQVEQNANTSAANETLPSSERELFLCEVVNLYRALDRPYSTSELGYSWFEDNNLLPKLAQFYKGNIPALFADLYSVQTNNSLEDVDLSNITLVPIGEQEILLRATEIEREILVNRISNVGTKEADIMQKMRSSHRHWGKGYSGRERRRKVGAIKHLTDKVQGQHNKGNKLWGIDQKSRERRSYLDTAIVIDKSIEYNEDILYITSDNPDPFMFSAAMTKTANEGNITLLSTNTNIKNTLMQNNFNLFFDSGHVKGEEEQRFTRKTKKQYTPLTLLPPPFVNIMKDDIYFRFRGQNWYEGGYTDDIDHLNEFFVYWNISPIKVETTIPCSMDRSLVGAVVTDFGFTNLGHEEIGLALFGADGKLKNGGHLVFREDAYALASIEKYMGQLDGYTQVNSKKLQSSSEWRIYKKNGE